MHIEPASGGAFFDRNRHGYPSGFFSVAGAFVILRGRLFRLAFGPAAFRGESQRSDLRAVGGDSLCKVRFHGARQVKNGGGGAEFFGDREGGVGRNKHLATGQGARGIEHDVVAQQNSPFAKQRFQT